MSINTENLMQIYRYTSERADKPAVTAAHGPLLYNEYNKLTKVYCFTALQKVHALTEFTRIHSRYFG